jgi:hypothetical protein
MVSVADPYGRNLGFLDYKLIYVNYNFIYWETLLIAWSAGKNSLPGYMCLLYFHNHQEVQQ